MDRARTYIDGFFTGYGRPHHWNENYTTREFGKSGVSIAMESHNQSGSVECTISQPLFLLFFVYCSCLRSFHPLLNFYGYLETKYLGRGEGYIFYWRIELLTSLSHQSVKNLVCWVFKQVSVTICADWHVLLQRDDTRTGWSFDKRVSYLHDS